MTPLRLRNAVTGGDVPVKISHWHGFVPALFLSVFAVGAGMVVLGFHAPLARLWNRTPRPEAKVIFDWVVNGIADLSRRVTDALHDGALTRYLAIAVVTIVAAGGWAFLGGTHTPGTRALTDAPAVVAAGWLVAMVATLALFRMHSNRLMLVILVSIVGLMVTLGFAYLSAPDLALTQLSVEVVTVILMLLALNYLPRETPVESSPLRRLRDLMVAGAAGVGAALLAYAMMVRNPAFPVISGFHLANAKPGGGGTNAVNVIIVDFRGYDTYGEIVVLGIAALVIFALVDALLAGGPANDRLLAWPPDAGQAQDRHPMMLVVGTRLLLPVAILVGVYIFLRGHNEPGGGFVAGLIVAIALVMQYIASGFGWTAARQRTPYHAMIGAGVMVAGLTGLGAWFNGMPFLTSAFAYVDLWPLERFEVATAMLFDLGVFLTVLGAVMLVLASLSRIAVRAGETVNAAPYDIDPGGR